jgi:hypothetical protein
MDTTLSRHQQLSIHEDEVADVVVSVVKEAEEEVFIGEEVGPRLWFNRLDRPMFSHSTVRGMVDL